MGAMCGFFFGKKKDCSAKSDEKIVCSISTVKNKKKIVHKTGRKMGLYGGGKIASSFAWEGKKGLFLVRSEKKFAQGKKP